MRASNVVLRRAPRRDRADAGPARVSGRGTFGRPSRRPPACRAPRLRDKGRAALGTAAARGHRASVAPLRILSAFPATRWITLRPPDRARSPGHVAHDPAAKWIRGTRPLMHRARLRAVVLLGGERKGRRVFSRRDAIEPVLQDGLDVAVRP